MEVPTLDVWHLHVVCGWTDIFEFLAGENVKRNHVDFGVTVLAGLGGGHLDNLAGTALQKTKEKDVISQKKGKILHFYLPVRCLNCPALFSFGTGLWLIIIEILTPG